MHAHALVRLWLRKERHGDVKLGLLQLELRLQVLAAENAANTTATEHATVSASAAAA